MQKKNIKIFLKRRFSLFYKRNYAFVIVLCLLSLLCFYSVKIEPYLLAETEYIFEHESIPVELDNFEIALLSDIHATKERKKLWNKVLLSLRQRNVDLILLGGDMINGNSKGLNVDEMLEMVAELSAKHGVFSIPGNHERRYRRGGMKAIIDAFNKRKMSLLLDENVIIQTPSGGKINLIGLDFYLNPHQKRSNEDWNKLIQKNMFNMVLLHTPSDFPGVPGEIPLTLAGHTHGGQIYLPLLGSVIRTPWYSRKYTYGKVEENGKTLLITSGLGSAYRQIRFCMMPEIVFIKLKSPHKK